MKNETILKEINDYIITMDTMTLIKLKIKLEDEIRKESLPKSNKKQDTIVKKMFKSIDKYRLERFEGYTKTNIDGEEFFCFLDGCRVYALRSNLGYNEVKEPFKINQINEFFMIGECEEVTLDLNELINDKKIRKANGESKIYTQIKNSYFNIDFLIEAIQVTGSNIIQITDSPTKPAIIVNKKTYERALILPVNKSTK